jgi:hypothetical protein
MHVKENRGPKWTPVFLRAVATAWLFGRSYLSRVKRSQKISSLASPPVVGH